MCVCRTTSARRSSSRSSNGGYSWRKDGMSIGRSIAPAAFGFPASAARRVSSGTVRRSTRETGGAVKSGLEIAQEAELRPITEIAANAGIPDDVLEPFGRYRAKIDLSIMDRLAGRPDGKLVITTAITPTKAGEGKTTTSLSLTQGLGT